LRMVFTGCSANCRTAVIFTSAALEGTTDVKEISRRMHGTIEKYRRMV